MKILGIDFGLAKIGLAIAEDGLVYPLEILRNDQKSLRKIIQIVNQEKIAKIVVGISQGIVGRKARQFGENLYLATGLEVVFQDETLTTKEALVKMIETGKKKRYRQEKEDAFAAAIILQEFLDKKNV